MEVRWEETGMAFQWENNNGTVDETVKQDRTIACSLQPLYVVFMFAL